MKVRIELLPQDGEEEIILRTRAGSNHVVTLQKALENLFTASDTMILTRGDTEFYLPKAEILFFETVDGKVAAHTKTAMYYTRYTLSQLEELLPRNFLRVSKSCILCIDTVSSITHNLTGSSRVTFQNTEKIVYVSRNYYKLLKERIYERRLSPFHNVKEVFTP